MDARRIPWLLVIWFGLNLTLGGCAEALRTGAPVILQPSPSVVSAGDTPITGTVAIEPGIADAALTDTPAQEAQFPAPVIDTSIPVPATDIAAIVEPTPVITIVAPTLPALSSQEKWRTQQSNRQVFDSPVAYITSGSQLWWYDPIHQQHVILGNITGEFEAQAHFALVGQGVEALEVPYEINQGLGLTALSPALVQRLQAAGYEQWVETYVIIGPGVQPG